MSYCSILRVFGVIVLYRTTISQGSKIGEFGRASSTILYNSTQGKWITVQDGGGGGRDSL